MATYYVSSVDGNNADSGADWANAKETIVGALAVATSDGDIILVDSNHSYTYAGAHVYWDVADGTHVSILSVNRTGSDALLAGAEERSSDGYLFRIFSTNNLKQSVHVNGVTFGTGTSNSSNNAIWFGLAYASQDWYQIELINCTFDHTSTGGNTYIWFGTQTHQSTSGARIRVKDCTFNLRNSAGNGACIIAANASVEIVNPTITYSGASKPDQLFGFQAGGSLLVCDGDISGYEKSGGEYVRTSSLTGGFHVALRNLKVSSTPGIVESTINGIGGRVALQNVDSADTNTVMRVYDTLGTLVEDLAVYVSDGKKVRGVRVSWKITTTATCDEGKPFVTPWIYGDVDSAANRTVGIRVLRDSVTDLDDRNCWIEVQYVSGASDTQGASVLTRNADPFRGTAAAYATDSEVWTESMTNPNHQTIAANITQGQACTIRARLHYAVTSESGGLYVDPKLLISIT